MKNRFINFNNQEKKILELLLSNSGTPGFKNDKKIMDIMLKELIKFN
jgi:hypothetical protein